MYFPALWALVCPKDNLTRLFLLLEVFHSRGATSGSGFALTEGTADHLELSSSAKLSLPWKKWGAKLMLHLLQYRPRIPPSTCKSIMLTLVLFIIPSIFHRQVWCSSQLSRKENHKHFWDILRDDYAKHHSIRLKTLRWILSQLESMKTFYFN